MCNHPAHDKLAVFIPAIELLGIPRLRLELLLELPPIAFFLKIGLRLLALERLQVFVVALIGIFADFGSLFKFSWLVFLLVHWRVRRRMRFGLGLLAHVCGLVGGLMGWLGLLVGRAFFE